MIDVFLYTLSGFTAGLLGGYLGIGGGEIMVPFLTIVLGHDIKTAVPVSVTAIVVNSISSSAEYLRRGMVDLELVIIISIFMVMGNITGSTVSIVVPDNVVGLLMTALLLYTGVSLLRGRSPRPRLQFADNRKKYLVPVAVLSLFLGAFAGLVGVGGGVFLIPLLYLVIGCPLSTARGTTAVIVSFSAAAAASVYFLRGAIDPGIVAPVVLGILIGGKAGGFLGTKARPIVIRVLFFLLMMYLAYRLGGPAIGAIL